jgi:hypothetical protein
VDYSEGIFMQSIYPRFGVGEEFNALAHFDRGTKRSNGLGKYGLAGDDAVHLTETSHSALIKDENQLSVLNSWGYYWGEKSIRSGNSSVDVEFPTRVLLEKSPPNMHMSRFLQALLNRGLFERSGSAPDVGFQAATRTAVKFVFISRHPIANSLAHKALKECAAIPVIELVEHWVVLHEYLAADFPLLVDARRLTLEAFVEDPRKHLLDLWEWMLGVNYPYIQKVLPEILAAADATVRKDPNAKYRRAYCAAATRSPENAKYHRTLVDLWGTRVERTGLDYDLDEWPCLAKTAQLAQQVKSGSRSHDGGSL